MTESIVWLIDLLWKQEPGRLAALIEQGKLKAYDRYDRFGDAKPEQQAEALDALARYAEAVSGPHMNAYLRNLDLARGGPNCILNTAGFVQADLNMPNHGHGLRDKLRAMEPMPRRAHLLELFRKEGGKRPCEGKGKGKRGALARLKEMTGFDRKNLGEDLDRAIQEQLKQDPWAQLTMHLHTAK